MIRKSVNHLQKGATGFLARKVSPMGVVVYENTAYRADLRRGQNTMRISGRRTLFTEAIQSGLVTMHESTGFPWWLTFASSTIVVRVGLFPLVRVQLNEGRKLSRAMPELNFLKQLATERLKSIPKGQSVAQWSDEVWNTFGIFRKGVKASLSLHEVSMLKYLGAPITNMVTFITFVWSIRDMLQGNINPDLGLEMGGMLWFEDLTEEDVEHILPIMAGITTYSAIEYSFFRPGSIDKTSLGFKIKDWIQTMSLCCVPVFLQLPAGCFCYWYAL